MTGSHAEPDKVAEVARLATAIADRILEQNAAGTTIPPEQFTMLVRAARMLLDNGAPWPASVDQVVMEVAKRIEQDEARPDHGPAASEGDDAVTHLTRFLGAVKRS
ncbi:hypothetical protein WYO_2925 [Methylobacterium sp. GXF4]|uniref:hypothetical protein n=1 Tax=Methylobacterium TaxID=407 RepID=UPI000269A94B|nr:MULTISPECIES: hypothetical protein [Methylobacterium]AYO84190.1 hypothetical protein EBB05_19280 [Methylobacterium brachiatum]EIZ84376.1 hypothetical protein WYO_2925 [Methylobacterium sp. GXF4]MDF2597250.1 hypothetical protein [Methylobacterium brachiatum]